MTQRFYQKAWFMWVMLIFLAPVGIFLLWWNNRYNKILRIALSVFFGIWFILVLTGVFSGSNNDLPSVTPPVAGTASPSPTAAPTVSSAATQAAAPEASPATSPEPTAEPEKTVSHEVTYSNARTHKDSIGTVWVQVIFEVENTGTTALYMSTGSYDLEDTSGKLIASSDMASVYPGIIEPGEKAYYIEETTLRDLTDAIELKVLPRPKASAAKVDNIKLPVTDFAISDDAFGLKMLGRVENTSEKEQGLIYIVVILFDENDTPIGHIFTILTEKLAPGNKVGFEGNSMTLPDDINAESVARYEVFAYPMQFQF